MRIQITGTDELFKGLEELKKAGPEAVTQFVTEFTLSVHRRAVRGIQRGPASGRVYRKYNPRRDHQASAPGEYPMSDTGRLASSIQFELPTNKQKPVGIVGTNLTYGKHLELKPEALGGRPWLSRALNTTVKDAANILRRAFTRKNRSL